jgi:hypothetical protein
MDASPMERSTVKILLKLFLIILIFITITPAVKAQEDKQTVIIVVGAPGTAEYGIQFLDWVDKWDEACSKGNIECIKIGMETTEVNDCDILKETLSKQADKTTAPLWLILIGHGTYDGREAKFNMKGPDITAAQLAEWLKQIDRPIAVINASSSSAPFLKEISAAGRIIITATKSGFEQNYCRFGQYFVEAIGQSTADLDKDGQTSLLEAFLFASHNVADFYSSSGRLATEHALIDDNGDTYGTGADWFQGIRPVKRARANTELDGYHAHQFHLLYSQAEASIPQALREERDKLELEVMRLRDSKENYAEEEYYSKLELLLYKIAIIYKKAGALNETP